MNSVKLFSIILLGLFLLQSCGEEQVQTEFSEMENLEQQIEEGYAEYKQEFPDHYVEVVTLEEMNRIYIENGLKPLGEKDFSKDDWTKLHDPNRALPRCSSGLSVYYGDINNSGHLSTLDLIVASNIVNIEDCDYGSCTDKVADTTYLSSKAKKFGLFTYWHRVTNNEESPQWGAWTISSFPYSTYGWYRSDVERCRMHLLGLLPC